MFDLKEAENNALEAIERIIEADPELSKSDVEEIRLDCQNERSWTFAAPVPKLINQGWSPGAITVSIDKTDGHVWTEEEHTRFYKELEKTRRRAGFLR